MKAISHLIIGPDNGLSTEQRQVIISTNAGIVLIGTFGKQLKWNFIWNSNIFIQENAFEKVVWKMAILSWSQCVNVSLVFWNHRQH